MPETNMNPDITTVKIGVRKLKEITIYPLSIASQLSVTEIIGEVVNKFASFDDKASETEIVQAVLDIIKDNITKLLSYVTDEKIDLDELTNPQLEAIINIIYDCNYKGIVKNSKDLIEKAKPLVASMRSLPKS